MSILLDASRHTLPAVELTNRLSVRVSSAGQSYLHRCFRPIGEDDRSVALKAKLRRNIFRAAPDVGRIEAERGRWGRLHCAVSHPRSSNRTCRFPASGSPSGFTAKHAPGPLAAAVEGRFCCGSRRFRNVRRAFGAGYDIEYRGERWKFHEHCEDATKSRPMCC